LRRQANRYLRKAEVRDAGIYTIGSPVGVKKREYVITSFTSDAGLYRADIAHGLGTTLLIYNVFATNTGADIFPEKVDRNDTATLKIWFAYQPASITVVLI